MACLGLFLLWVMRRLFWYSSSKVAAERPLPTLLVNFVRLSEKPNTVFFTKLAAPCGVLGCEVIVHRDTYFGDANPKFPVTMDDHTVERFIEDIRDTRTDVREQPDGVANEIRRPENTVELAKDFLFVVVHDTRL